MKSDIAAIDAEQRRIKQAADRALPEREWQAKVINAAETFGWWVWHDTDSRRNRAGLPDLILIRGPRLIFAELKAEGGRLRPAQAAFFDRIRRVPAAESHIWYPCMWDGVLEILK